MADKQTPKIGQGKAGPGRPKGLPNRTTTLLKDALLQAASEAGGSNDAEGLVAFLRVAAVTATGPFLGLLGKVLPLQVAMTDPAGNATDITIRYVGPIMLAGPDVKT